MPTRKSAETLENIAINAITRQFSTSGYSDKRLIFSIATVFYKSLFFWLVRIGFFVDVREVPLISNDL